MEEASFFRARVNANLQPFAFIQENCHYMAAAADNGSNSRLEGGNLGQEITIGLCEALDSRQY